MNVVASDENRAMPVRRLEFRARLRDFLTVHDRLATGLFIAALVLFAVTRLWGLERFPIYFFTDEAVPVLSGADLVHHHFRGADGHLLPTYFQNGLYWNLGTSVYIHALTYELFGYSVFATRAVSALVALSAGAAVSLTLRDVFRCRAWWVGAALLVVTPAWFLHSRTAFETVMATAFYAWTLYFYLRYVRFRDRSIYAAVLFAGLAFYTYSPMQFVLLASAVAFGVSNARLHMADWRRTLRLIPLTSILAFPHLRFAAYHGEDTYSHLRVLDSYWVRPGLSLQDKLGEFLHQYNVALSPSYWFGADPHVDLVRHMMKGYGNISALEAPFILLGVAVCLWQVRIPTVRTLILAALTAPMGTALVEVQITRAMAMLVPLTLLGGIGASLTLDALARRYRYNAVAIASFALVAAAGLAMTGDALANGPTWYTGNQQGDMQYGARQLAAVMDQMLADDQGVSFVVSPDWANGTDSVFRFLMPGEPRMRVASIQEYRLRRTEIPAGAIFVLPTAQFVDATTDPHFSTPEVVKIVDYPSGEPGFYFVRLSYAPDADRVFADEALVRRTPVTDILTIDKEMATVVHSPLDLGRIEDIFDGDAFTLARTTEANPAEFDVTFGNARALGGVSVTTRTMRARVDVDIFPVSGGQPVRISAELANVQADPTLVLRVDGPPLATQHVRISVRDLDQPGDDAHVHVRDIGFDD
jgi:hypothetical protein